MGFKWCLDVDALSKTLVGVSSLCAQLWLRNNDISATVAMLFCVCVYVCVYVCSQKSLKQWWIWHWLEHDVGDWLWLLNLITFNIYSNKLFTH